MRSSVINGLDHLVGHLLNFRLKPLAIVLADFLLILVGLQPVIRRRAERHLEKGRIVIFAAGVGAPFFTTDSGAALRAAEMQCDALFKGTSVDGVYDADPKKVATATRYETLSYDRVLADNLKVMDASAVSLCRDNNIPIVVFSIREQGNILKVLDGSGTSTVVTSEGN